MTTISVTKCKHCEYSPESPHLVDVIQMSPYTVSSDEKHETIFQLKINIL